MYNLHGQFHILDNVEYHGGYLQIKCTKTLSFILYLIYLENF